MTKDASDKEPDLDQAAEALTGKKRPKDYVGGLVGEPEEKMSQDFRIGPTKTGVTILAREAARTGKSEEQLIQEAVQRVKNPGPQSALQQEIDRLHAEGWTDAEIYEVYSAESYGRPEDEDQARLAIRDSNRRIREEARKRRES